MFNIFVKDLVILVTGANRKHGIGRALIDEAIKRGAKKIYASARDISQLDDLVEKFPAQVVPIALELTKFDQIQRTAKVLASDTQILINNAGACGYSGCLFNYDEQLARKEMEVNYFASLHLINAFSKNIIENGGGAIVNIISIGGLYPSPAHITYSASKAALYSLTQALRIEMKMNSFTTPVFGVYPGPIDTDMSKNLDVRKESAENLAIRVFDGMEQGVLDITTDELSDYFKSFLKKDLKAIEEVKKAFSKLNRAN